MAALTPEPQVVMTGLVEIDAVRGESISASASPVLSWPCSRISTKGRLSAPGMWPLLRPGRGSGVRPSKRSAGRASTTCAAPSPSGLARRRAERRSCGRAAGVKVAASAAPRRASIGRPSCIHFGRPPSRIKTSLHAEGAQRPPDPRRGEQALRVVDHEAHAVAEAELGHRAAKAAGFGSMCGRPLDVSAITSMLKNTAPGICACEEFRVAFARPSVGRCQERVDHAQVGFAEMRVEPFGA